MTEITPSCAHGPADLETFVSGVLALFSAERALPLIIGSGPPWSSSQGRARFMRTASAVVILDACGSEG